MEDKYVYGEVATKVLDSIYKEFEYNFTGEDIKKMMKDLDIASAVNTLKRSICAKELNIVAYEESNKDKIQDIESRLNIKKLNETLNNIIESRFYGYSVSEIVYAEDWSFTVKAKSRELFDFDKESKRWFYKSDFDKVYLEDNKFLVSVNNPHKAYKGESILYELFQEYQIKRELDKKLAGIIDKYGDRIIWYLYDPNAEESEVKEQAEGLKQARNGHVIAIPGSANLEMDKQFGFITLNDLKTEIHQQLLVRYEKKIDKYILGNTLAQNEGSNGTGSYAQAQTHAQQQETVVTDLATYVEEELRKLMVIDADINGYDSGDFYIKLSDKIDIDEEIEREKKKKEVEKEEANILSMKMDVISKMSQTGYKISLDEMKEFTGFRTLVEVEKVASEFQQKKADKIGVTRELRKKYEESYREVSIELPKIAKIEDIFNLSVNLGQLEQDMILGILWGYASVRNINSEFAEKLNPFDLAFDDAIKYFIDVERIGYDFINGVQSEVYDKFRYILDNTNLEIQLRLIKNIQKNLETGGTFQDWLANSKEEIEKMGLGKKGSYFETVYRTNLQTAYSVGNYKAQVENKKTNPYWLYDGVRDGREQDHTKNYDGKIWRADDKIWDSIYPPNDYNCRCNVIALDEEEFADYGIPLEKSNKRFLEEQKESLGKFGINPAKNYWDVMKKSGTEKKKLFEKLKDFVLGLMGEKND